MAKFASSTELALQIEAISGIRSTSNGAGRRADSPCFNARQFAGWTSPRLSRPFAGRNRASQAPRRTASAGSGSPTIWGNPRHRRR